MSDFDTTIVAPATHGTGAIGIIRISGKDAIDLVDGVFHPADPGRKLDEAKGFSLIYGDIKEEGDIIDDVLILLFRSPASYTGEDSVEISHHASPYIQRRIIDILVSRGAVAALPGEFTQRAYMNRKMDLSQAEAVADLIASESEAAHRLAIKQMRGGYSEEIRKLRSEMLHFASMLELELDFAEEEVEFAGRDELKEMVTGTKQLVDSLSDSFKYGNVIKKGIPVAIVGKPNVGKSTLLNAILKEDRAIVSEIPGTTRDVIEDTVIIDGLMYRFIDTAGLRETADVIENLGIRKTYQKIGQAEIVILMGDASDDAETINSAYWEIARQIGGDKRLILAINKTDLVTGRDLDKLKGELECDKQDSIFISAGNGGDIENLLIRLKESLPYPGDAGASLVVTNIRHFNALKSCSESLERVLEGLSTGITEDFIAMDLRQAIHYLGEITGEISTDEILGNIFKNFCIGK